MIYVRRDPKLIPEALLQKAEAAQAELLKLPAKKRKAFIKSKAAIWREFSQYLAKMSYGKCWYSESNDPQSFFDIDHFRPKSEAKRTEHETDEGYPWLAFSWENFRYAAQRSNRLSTDEATEIVYGKSSWFPLLAESPKATWKNQDISCEQPMLLDPTVREDVDLIDIADDGRACESWLCVSTIKKQRVQRSIELYGLNLSNLVSARKRVIRDIQENYRILQEVVQTGGEMSAIQMLVAKIRRATHPKSPYSKAARQELIRQGGAALCAQVEDEVA